MPGGGVGLGYRWTGASAAGSGSRAYKDVFTASPERLYPTPPRRRAYARNPPYFCGRPLAVSLCSISVLADMMKSFRCSPLIFRDHQ